MTIDFTKFNLPKDADIAALQGLKVRQLADGVSVHYSGHDEFGLAYRFFVYPRYNKVKSEATKSALNPSGIEIFDPIEMMEVFVDRKTRVHKMVTDRIRHRRPEEYRRFQEGLEAPGTPLDRWGVMPSFETATLIKDGIFTVEQFSIQPADKVQHRYPPSFFDYFTRAQQFVAAKAGNADTQAMADKIVDFQRAYAAQEQRIAELEAKLNKKPGRKPSKKKAEEVE